MELNRNESRWYKVEKLPDLTLNKYASLADSGISGVLEKHNTFLRQINRNGILSGNSFHLYYLYLHPDDPSLDHPGNRLQIFLEIRGKADSLKNADAVIRSAPLAELFDFKETVKLPDKRKIKASLEDCLQAEGIPLPQFKAVSMLSKNEVLLQSNASAQKYYYVPEWELNDDARLYSMFQLMDSLKETALYRVDLYPVEYSEEVRRSLGRPMGYLRQQQDDRSLGRMKDYEGKNVLKRYEDILDGVESSPHFIANVMVFAASGENAAAILDAAGSEGLKSGKYNTPIFYGNFNYHSFLDGSDQELRDRRTRMTIQPNRKGLLVTKEDTLETGLSYLSTLFSVEEISPFFRFPVLYDGEVIQTPKETAPEPVDAEGALFLGKDKNGYDVHFPIKLLPKHAFIAGVPGSGKTNTMHHITSSLWKRKDPIPFLVLEPAKQEYRALCNDPGMKDLYLFSPNADMSFPLHINPFEMPKGTIVAEHIRKMCEVFEGAFPLEPPMPFLLDTAIEAVYRKKGWIPEHVYTGNEKTPDGQPRRFPTISMLYKQLEEELKHTRYSEEVRGNMESALQVRIGSLLRREMGDVFDVPSSTFPPEKWLEVPAVIELESMGTGPANFLTLLLCTLIRETLKVNPKSDKSIRHVIFIEEAHNLIGPQSEAQSGADADPKTAATAFIVKMLAEVRALKEGIVIADQLPTVMAQEVLKNTGLKLGLRITSEDDRALLGSTMAASALQLEQMSTFAVGESLIFYEKLQKPFSMRIHEWCGEIQDDQEKEAMVSSRNDTELREALINNPTYRKTVERSISIIGAKYFQKMNEMEKQLNSNAGQYKSISVLEDQIQKLNDDCKMLLSRQGSASVQAEFQVLNNQLNIFERQYDSMVSQASNDSKLAQLIKDGYQDIQSLIRLYKGRWTRAGFGDSQLLTNILVLIISYSDLLMDQYQKAKQAVSLNEGFKGFDRTMEQLSSLRKEAAILYDKRRKTA